MERIWILDPGMEKLVIRDKYPRFRNTAKVPIPKLSIQWATLERVHGEGARGSSSELTEVALRWEAVSITNAGDAADRREALPGAEATGDVAAR